MTLVIYCIYPIKNKKTQTILRQTRIPIPNDTTKTKQFVDEVHHKNWFVETLDCSLYIVYIYTLIVVCLLQGI